MSKGSGGGSDVFFFIGIFGLIVLIWVYTGGVARPGSWTGPFLTSPTSPIATEIYSFPRAPDFTDGTAVTPQETARDTARADADIRAYGELSPYRGKVTIEEVRLGEETNPDDRDKRDRRDEKNEYVTLEIAQNVDGHIDITGWALYSTKYKERTLIPYGVETPTLGQVTPAERILVRAGDQVIISSGKSPLGFSFRENMCTGYFAQHQDFTPRMSLRCPNSTSEFDERYAGPTLDADRCRDHVASINSCEYVSYVPREVPAACKTFVDQYLHYNGCVIAHKTDDDFFDDTWRVYLGKSDTLYADTHETVRLLDASGLVVDVYAY